MTAISELQNFTFISKYARWNDKEQRRETWRESVDRVRNMMLRKYADKSIDDEINWAYDMVWKKKVLGSQRSLQFAGPPIEKKCVRIYNCSASYCNRLKFFQEVMYILLCGSGVGTSIQKHHINKLPTFSRSVDDKPPQKTYMIPDMIEGWSDSIGILLSSYFKRPIFKEYSECNVKFNYSKIRPKGSTLSSSTGKAPGPKPLEKCLENIRKLLNRCVKDGQDKLRTIDAYDIVCHIADGVLSGGIRRSSCLALFSLDDQEMLEAKSGNWILENPQRGRCNNSIVLMRNQIERNDFEKIFTNIKCFGEPGFLFVDDYEMLVNPCQPGWAYVYTPQGLKTFNEINIGEKIWSSEGWTTIINKKENGIKRVFAYTTTAGTFYGTKNHQIVSNGNKIKVGDADSIDIIPGPDFDHGTSTTLPQYIMDGLVLGDGSVHKASNNLVYLNIGEKDHDYFENKELNSLIKQHRPGLGSYAYTTKTNITALELPKTYNRYIPERYKKGTKDEIASFLCGLFSANGGICGDRVALKATSKRVILNAQTMLSILGIRSYYTTNKSKDIKFKNGTYTCKQSYDLNISKDIDKFRQSIGFIQNYKREKLYRICSRFKRKSRLKTSYDIVDIKELDKETVYDITVDNKSHTYWSNGCNVSNCGEVGLYAYDEDGKIGWSFCNLATINCGSIKDKEDFYERCKAASIIGTLQAGFTDFTYLGQTTKNIVEREALLGVSMTGMMDNPDIALNEECQREGAKIIKKTNAEISKKIGINVAARTTVVKPEGNSSCLLGSSSGIHPHHAKRYLRRVQNNTLETPYQFFKQNNPQATEKSTWSNNSQDENIIFPIEVPDGSKTKNVLPALEMLEIIKLTQQNWIGHGKRKDLCVQPWLTHNVSNTVFVKEDEWDSVIDFVYKNRKHFSGLSFISEFGDKDYPQAPFTTVHMSHEIVSKYGNGAIWCSGLIELGLEAFDGNLWLACDYILGKYVVDKAMKQLQNSYNGNGKTGIKKVSEEATLIGKQLKLKDKAEHFADKYFEGDVQKLTYCLKDVHNWKLYCDLEESFKPVDYTKMVEKEDNTRLEEEVACGNGACLI